MPKLTSVVIYFVLIVLNAVVTFLT